MISTLNLRFLMSIQSVINVSKLIKEYISEDEPIPEKVNLIVLDFLSKLILEIDYDYVQDNNIISVSRKGMRSVPVATYSDQSQWVVLLAPPLRDRFCGFLYLQNALKKENAQRLEAAPNKIGVHNKQIIYLSQYCGEERLDSSDFIEYRKELAMLSRIGFKDMMGASNLRKKDGKIFVFDTERSSFAPNVYKEIDAFEPLHDRIVSAVDKGL